jgi:hypothetical protein
MALPGDDPSPPSVYGIRLKITPDVSGANPWKAYSILSNSTSADGTYTNIAWRFGTGVWYFDHTLNVNSPRQYYKVRHELGGYTASSYTGPVDALPTNLAIELWD